MKEACEGWKPAENNFEDRMAKVSTFFNINLYNLQFGSRVVQADKKLQAARKLDKELVARKKALETETNAAKTAATAAENKATLI